MPHANTDALNAHLAEIARTVEPGAHAVVMLDQAGWHTSSTLKVPPQYHPDGAPAPFA